MAPAREHVTRTPPTETEETDQIGARLRRLREERRLSIRQLARDSGVSASLISSAERGLSEPSVGVLKRLAQVLGVNLMHFFSQPGSAGETVVRRDERRRLHELRGVRYELLGPDHVRAIEPIHARLAPGAGMDDTLVQHEGQEWGMVLEGRLTVWVGTEIYFLDPGDAIYFPSSVPHRVANPTDAVTEYVWVNLPASY